MQGRGNIFSSLFFYLFSGRADAKFSSYVTVGLISLFLFSNQVLRRLSQCTQKYRMGQGESRVLMIGLLLARLALGLKMQELFVVGNNYHDLI